MIKVHKLLSGESKFFNNQPVKGFPVRFQGIAYLFEIQVQEYLPFVHRSLESGIIFHRFIHNLISLSQEATSFRSPS